jgi:hypothetical protein
MHLRLWIKVVLLFLITKASIGQPWYFNNVYNPNNTWASSLSIIAEDDGYFGTAISDDSTTGYKNICSYKLNLNGDMVFWKNYGIIGSDLYPGYYGSLVKSGNDYALFGSRKDWTTTRSSGLFYKFNSEGDTILTRPFTSPIYNNLVGRACDITYNNEFILLGEVSVGSNYSDVVLIKTDSNGIEEWRTQHGTSIDDNANSIIQTPDGGYAFGVWSRIPGQEETADPLVYKTDGLGNEVWHLNLGGPFLDDKAIVCNTMDSCIMVLTTNADSMDTPEYAYSRVNLVKIDLQGNIIWNRKYGASMSGNFISSIICLENGDVVSCGYSPPPSYVYFNWTGWIFRFNADGDSLWYKNYYYYPENPDFAENYLYDVSYTSDHGFIAIGQAYILSPSVVQQMWALKVDSIGCEIPNCWVGIEEETEGPGDKETGGQEDWGRLAIWPNPVGNIVNCQLSDVNFPSNSSTFNLQPSMTIYDVFGRTALSPAPLPTSSQTGGGVWSLDVSALPPGIYFVVVRDDKTVIGTGKFVVAR